MPEPIASLYTEPRGLTHAQVAERHPGWPRIQGRTGPFGRDADGDLLWAYETTWFGPSEDVHVDGYSGPMDIASIIATEEAERSEEHTSELQSH